MLSILFATKCKTTTCSVYQILHRKTTIYFALQYKVQVNIIMCIFILINKEWLHPLHIHDRSLYLNTLHIHALNILLFIVYLFLRRFRPSSPWRIYKQTDPLPFRTWLHFYTEILLCHRDGLQEK